MRIKKPHYTNPKQKPARKISEPKNENSHKFAVECIFCSLNIWSVPLLLLQQLQDKCLSGF